jgi:hypothetical protein
MKMVLVAAHVPQQVVHVLHDLSQYSVSSHAGKAHYELVDHLTKVGFFVECEHPIYFSDGTQERIDMMAHLDGMILAIEVDGRFKRKSVKRLQLLKGSDVYLVIFLLQGNPKELPAGIDALVMPNACQAR